MQERAFWREPIPKKWQSSRRRVATVKMNKNVVIDGVKIPNPFFGLIKKYSKSNIMLGTDYEKRVNNNLSKEEKETDFKAQENKVGSHVSKCVLFNENTQKHYLQYERFDEIKPQVEYKLNDSTVTKESFASYLPPVNNFYENQGLDRTVNVLSVTLDNIKELSLNKEHYVIQ